MGSPAAASKVRGWLERMMHVGHALPYASAIAAHLALEELSEDASVQAAESEGALLAFASESPADEPPELVSKVPIRTAPSVTVIHPPQLTGTVIVDRVAAAAKPVAEPKPRPEVKPAASAKPAAEAKPTPAAKPAAAETPSPAKAGARIRTSTLMIAGLSALVLAEGAAVAGLLYWQTPAHGNAGVAGPDDAAGATRSSDELSVAALAPRQPTGASAARAKRAPPAATTSASKSAAPVAASRLVGGLTVSSAVDLIVSERGTTIGSTAAPLAVQDGRHTLEFVNQTLGFRLTMPVSITGGRMTTLKVPLPNGRVSINADPWARVAIDGAEVGSTPLANLAVPIGTHEVVFAHPVFGERRQTVVVKVDGISRVTQSFK
jgi:hypothetical protein